MKSIASKIIKLFYGSKTLQQKRQMLQGKFQVFIQVVGVFDPTSLDFEEESHVNFLLGLSHRRVGNFLFAAIAYKLRTLRGSASGVHEVAGTAETEERKTAQGRAF